MSKTVVLKFEDREIFLKEHGNYWVASTSKEAVGGQYVPNEKVGQLLHRLLLGKSLKEWHDEIIDALQQRVDNLRSK